MDDGTDVAVKYRRRAIPILSLVMGKTQIAQVSIHWFPSIHEANVLMTELGLACIAGQSKHNILLLRGQLLRAAGAVLHKRCSRQDNKGAKKPRTRALNDGKDVDTDNGPPMSMGEDVARIL